MLCYVLHDLQGVGPADPAEADNKFQAPGNSNEDVDGNTADGSRALSNSTDDDESNSSTTITDGDHDSDSGDNKDGIGDKSQRAATGRSSERRARPQRRTGKGRGSQAIPKEAPAGTGFTLNLSDADVDDETLHQVSNSNSLCIIWHIGTCYPSTTFLAGDTLWIDRMTP